MILSLDLPVRDKPEVPDDSPPDMLASRLYVRLLRSRPLLCPAAWFRPLWPGGPSAADLTNGATIEPRHEFAARLLLARLGRDPLAA